MQAGFRLPKTMTTNGVKTPAKMAAFLLEISIIYSICMAGAKKRICSEYGHDFWNKFKTISSEIIKQVILKTPYIGKSIFLFNYQFAPAYISWLKAALKLGLSADEANRLIWLINEEMVKMIPKCFMKQAVNIYIGGFRKKAAKHQKLSDENRVHPYDFKIRYREVNENCFEIDIYECAMIKLAKDFDALDLFPSICRMDYLFSYYMGNGFERTKTLGDGNDCCNCRYIINGSCEWAPEKGFAYRK